MRAKKIFAAVSAVCVSIVLATSVFAQDDLDNLLGELEKDNGKKTEQAKPAAEAAPAPAAEETTTPVIEPESGDAE